MSRDTAIRCSLLAMRLTIFVVMLMWVLDKFINPGHAAAVFEKFYFIAGLKGTVLTGLAVIELVILTGFLLGIQKRFCYGAVLAFHTVSTVSSYRQYLSPFEGGSNLLFFAAWPMLAGCVLLYLLRDDDVWCSLVSQS